MPDTRERSRLRSRSQIFLIGAPIIREQINLPGFNFHATVTVDDETYRGARIKAAERNTSVSALVKHFLAELAVGERSD